MVGESVRSNAAVDQTKGQILTYSGQPAVTYYFSTSGGHTENVEFSFVGSLSKPWLVGVPDPYDYHSPYHRWQRPFSAASLDSALGAPGRFKAAEGPAARRVAARGARPRRRHERVADGHGAAGARRARAARHLVHGRPRAQLGCAPALGAALELGPAARAGARARRRLPARSAHGRGSRCSAGPTPAGARSRACARTAAGAIARPLPTPGLYRVKGGSVAGPAVRVR